MKFDFEIAVDQQTRALDQTFEVVPDSEYPPVPAGQPRPYFFKCLNARKTFRFNLAIEISFVPFSQSTFNFSVLRGSQVDFLLFNLF